MGHISPNAGMTVSGRLARALGSSQLPSDLVHLKGGLEAEAFAFQLGQERLVVKVFADDRGQAAREFDNLTVVSVARVPTPDPVLIDDEGAWFGAPAIVMTALPGRPEMHPRNRTSWIDGAAEALASIHEIPTGRASRVRTPRWQRWRPSTEGMSSDASRTDAVLTRLYELAETLPTVVSHDDYNPGNLFFDAERLSGVVDWADIAIEPRQAGVALFRHFLAIHPGGQSPQTFLDAYERAAETALNDQPLWDTLYGLRGARPVDLWVLAFRGLGLNITSSEIQERSRAWVRNAIHRAGA